MVSVLSAEVLLVAMVCGNLAAPRDACTIEIASEGLRGIATPRLGSSALVNASCVVHNTSECERLLPEFQSLPGLPAPPSKLQLQTLLRPDSFPAPSDILYPGILVRWSPPWDSSRRDLQGFRLTVKAVGGPDLGTDICRLFDLRGANFSWNQETQLDFSYEVWPLTVHMSQQDPSIYMVSLSSLPLPSRHVTRHSRTTQEAFVTVPAPRAGGTYEWNSGLTFRNDSDSGSILVYFNLVPPIHRVVAYSVALLDLRDVSLAKTANLGKDEHTITFEKLKPGVYKVRVIPVQDHHELMPGVESIPIWIHDRPEAASTSEVAELATAAVATPFNSESQESGLSIKSGVGAFIGVALGAALLVIIFHLTYQRRKEEPCHSPSRKELLKKLCVSKKSKKCGGEDGAGGLPRRKVFLLFSDKLAAERELVSAFACYLQTYCQCDVLYYQWYWRDIRCQGVEAWITQSMEKADSILLLHTDDALALYRTIKGGLTLCSPENNPAVFLLKFALSQCMTLPRLQQRLAVVDFHVGSASRCLGYDLVAEDRVFGLMEEFRRFLCHVHQLDASSNNLEAYDLPLTSSHTDTEEGKQLLLAQRALNLLQGKGTRGEGEKEEALQVEMGVAEALTDMGPLPNACTSDYFTGSLSFFEPELYSDGDEDENMIMLQLCNYNKNAAHSECISLSEKSV